MTAKIEGLDSEIVRLEQRIGQRHHVLALQKDDIAHALRAKVTSPASLLTGVGVGFAVGRSLFGGGGAATSSRRRASPVWPIVGSVARTALSLAHTPLLVWISGWLGKSTAETGAAEAATTAGATAPVAPGTPLDPL